MATKKGISQGFKKTGSTVPKKGMPANFAKGGKSTSKPNPFAGGKK